jgi:hypothetical protein
MKRFIVGCLVVSAIAVFSSPVEAQDGGLPKVDFRVGTLRVDADRLAIPITNAGFATSPPTKLYVGVTDDPARTGLFRKVVNLRPLEPNRSRTMVLSGLPTGQRIIITAVADPYKTVLEANEDDNTAVLRSGPLTRLGPDLAIRKMEVFRNNIRVTIRNNGPDDLMTPVAVTMNATFGFKPFASDTKVIPRLGRGRLAILVLNVGKDMPQGTFVTVQVDAGDRIKEGNEENNTETKSYVLGRP